MNKKIALSGLSIFAALALIGGATFAFFSDEETSENNTFTAGEIDLQIDNRSYYNGILNLGTTWLQPTDLTNELFFNFLDVKPDDYGEDTISVRVSDNDQVFGKEGNDSLEGGSGTDTCDAETESTCELNP